MDRAITPRPQGSHPERSGSRLPAPELPAALADPGTFGVQGPVEVRETHASWVFLAGPRAYKVKKPLRLAFLDYSTLERRHAACKEELRVNRELAGDIYERVAAIVQTPEGLRLAAEDHERAIEYALVMRRFDESRTLAGAIAAGWMRPEDAEAVARRVARFHAGAPACSGAGAAPSLRAWRVNLRELEQSGAPPADVATARRFGEAFVAAHGQELDRRAHAGLVRDCHGDLRCEHVLLGEQVRIIDRIEFDPRLRCIDVGCDLAFLLMDLELRGRRQTARGLLDAYRSAGGDPGGEELVAFFGAHWALVRAKVEMIAASQHSTTDRDTVAAPLMELAERLSWRARGPRAFVLAGPPASGKSTFAAELARRSGLPVISSDLIRKHLAGIAPTERAGEECYTAEFTRRTYRALGYAAAQAMSGGEGVVIDATCARASDRAELLDALGCEEGRVLFARCTVPLACAVERAQRRMRERDRVSDASPEIVARMFEGYEEMNEPGIVAVDVDGAAAPPEQVRALAAAADDRMWRAP